MLNHCRTNCHGKIDIIVNDVALVQGFQEARWDNFGEQNFNIPSDCLKPGENELIIRLSKGSQGVYWLSDLRLDVNYS
ncbi:hypothetical protein FSP39_018653 [Pinctada imbricata]|uniref:Uncharacterized protein n=1 Tax=Pinctada imbricata TaxID=66713 RepID=A0AA88Y3Z9_PINIB|nr:hypothetical protein FSP39_018653 [Pinctada imbricata]